MHKHVFLCGLSDEQRTAYTDGQFLSLAEGAGNLNLRLDYLRKKLVGTEPRKLTDLIEIASYVFAADRTTRRGTEIFKNYGEDWRRELHMIVAVREPGFWNQLEVKVALADALGFASEDGWAFDFVTNEHPIALQDYLGLREEPDDAAGGTSVVLFSGGLDSLAGAAHELTTSNRHVVLVSHRNTPTVGALQKDLASSLAKSYPKRVTHVWVDNSLTGKLEDREETQRTRSFFFVAMAAVTAHIEKADRIRLFENGVMSVNLPIATQVVGARASRSTHPRTLYQLQRLIALVSAHEIEVGNPFLWQTKAEVIHKLVGSGFGNLITRSFSCTRSRKSAVGYAKHCGSCVQCIQRRISTLGGGAGELDEAEGYEIDLFTGVREDTRDRVMALGSIQLALDCTKITDLAFMGRFALEVSQVAQAYPTAERDDVAKKLVDLFRRHGSTVRDIAVEALQANAASIVDKTVAPGSLLAVLASQNINEHRSIEVREPEAVRPTAPTTVTPITQGASDQIIIAVDAEHKQIRVNGIAALKGTTIFPLLQHLIEMSVEDRAALLAPKKFNCKPAKILADDLDLSDEGAVTQAVSRARQEILEGFAALTDVRPDSNAIIESVPRRGYRLNPLVVIVSVAEFMEL